MPADPTHLVAADVPSFPLLSFLAPVGGERPPDGAGSLADVGLTFPGCSHRDHKPMVQPAYDF